jgi:Icc-related predicted phosphoesterase
MSAMISRARSIPKVVNFSLPTTTTSNSKHVELVVLSDTHHQHDLLDEQLFRDEEVKDTMRILVHCGDFTQKGSREEVAAFNDWLGSEKMNAYFKHKILVSGNHDRGHRAKREFPDEEYSKMFTNIKLLDNEAVELEGIRFFGTSFTKSETYYGELNVTCDILLSHYPPSQILDRLTNTNRQVGSLGLRNAIENQILPGMHLFGHVHEARGMCKDHDRDILYLNCSNAGDHGKVVNPPVRILVQIGEEES